MSWYREPLLHFVAIGAFLFGLHTLTRDTNDQEAIVVDSTRVDQIARQFARQWDREPTFEELLGEVETFVRSEVLFREAKSLGLDREDDNIRRHLVAKMRAISPEIAGLAEPTGQQLATYIEEHVEEFRSPDRVRLEQVFFDPTIRGSQAQDDARALLPRMQEVDLIEVGDSSTSLQPRYSDLSDRDAREIFGESFADHVFESETNRWLGPIESTHGFHLVLIRNRIRGTLPSPERIEKRARRLLAAEQTREAEDALFERLSNTYEIRIESEQFERQSSTTSDSRQPLNL